MNMYTLIFKKKSDGQEFTQTIKAESDAAAKSKANVILADHPVIVDYELYKSGEKVNYIRGD